MPDLSNTAVRLYRRLFGGTTTIATGSRQLLDGNSAVAMSEAALAEVALLGGSFPADGAELTWRAECLRRGTNQFGQPLQSQSTEGPRGALAAAIGQALTGHRATLFLSGPDLVAAHDLLRQAAGQGLPLVIHLANRALNSHGAALGSGDEAVALAAESGCFVLYAGNVQQAVDFTLIARRLAERSLTPVVVAIDGEETALALQEVELPSAELIGKMVGASGDVIEAIGSVQQLAFGEQRRRTPRRHDLDHPALHGSRQGSESFALAAAARSVYGLDQAAALLDEAFARFAQLTGRHHAAIGHHRSEKAKLLLVAQGAAAETVAALSERLRKRKLGAIAIHARLPFGSDALIEQLRGKQAVVVLERCEAPLAGDTPLLRQLRAVIANGIAAGSLKATEVPKLHSVLFGLGGLPLRSRDLAALCDALPESLPTRSYLGLDFGRGQSRHPKRQVLLDQLRRDHPELVRLGISGRGPGPDLRPDGATTVAVERISGQGGETLASEAALLLQQLIDGQFRGRPAVDWERFAAPACDRFTFAAGGLRDPGSETPVELAVIAGGDALPAGMVPGGGVVVVGEGEDESLWGALSAHQQQWISEKGLKLFAIAPYIPEDETACDPLLQETLLGALFAALLGQGLAEFKITRLLSLREESHREIEAADEREQRLEAFRHGLEQLLPVDYAQLPVRQPRGVSGERVPMAVRHLGANRDGYDSLPRFWDQVGLLYRDGEAAELTADPYMATGALPPLSATFRDFSSASPLLPSFDPTACTGCGECWGRCPDSAIAPVAATPAALLDAAMRLGGADALRQIASKLAGRVTALCKKGESEGATAAELFDSAFAWLQEKAPFAEERKAALEAAYAAAREQFAALPLAVTEPLFHAAEREKKEGGELLSITVNADACKGCGLCIAACEPRALSASVRDTAQLEQAREVWLAWERAPDTPSSTIERVSRSGDLDPIAAQMLSRICSQALAGGDGSEAGSGEKIALRQLLATVEYQQQPLLHRFIGEISEVRGQLGERIRALLTDALPTEDLDSLASALARVKTREVDISTLVGDKRLEGSGVDATRLRRLIELSQRLGELHWRLSEGDYGLGRARYGVVATPGPASAWAGVFPYNPFQVPVVVDGSGDAAQIAAGIVAGQLGETAAAHTLLLRAREEIAATASRARASGEMLGWHQLDEAQRRLAPPLLLIGSERELAGRGFGQIAWLLNSGLPVKIVVLNELGLGLDSGGVADLPTAAYREPSADLALMALSQRNAFVAQCSIGYPAQLRESLRGALRHTGPALIHLHTPSPERHGFAVDGAIEQARMAVESRTFPLFRYDPSDEGVFGSRLSLDGNPEATAEWVVDSDGVALTPADWAHSEHRFAGRFRPLGGDDPAPLALPDYLALDAKGRGSKSPVVDRLTCDDRIERLRVAPEVVEMVEERRQAWRTLQELAGTVTPFTERVRAEAEAAVAAAHQAEIAALKAGYEAKLAQLQTSMEGDITLRIRDRLVALAGYNGRPTTEDSDA